LLHPIVMRAVQHVISGSGPVGRLVTWAAVIAVSWLFYLLVEQRFIARARQPRELGSPGQVPASGTPSRA
jgi:peptidoglycan/LPS O-acetylase OafA/YrhL